jgi:hypothetical protein
MALYTCTYPTKAGSVVTAAAVSSSDTISGNDVNAGCVLIVTVGATPTNVTFTDPGHTLAGNTGTQAAVTVAANTSKAFGNLAAFIDPSTNLVTVGYSSTTGATWQLVA